MKLKVDPENLNAYYLVLLVVVQHDARSYFLGFYDSRIVQTQIKSISLGIYFQLHNFPFILRSKYPLTTRSGTTCVFTMTRSTRLPNSGIFANRLSNSGSVMLPR